MRPSALASRPLASRSESRRGAAGSGIRALIVSSSSPSPEDGLLVPEQKSRTVVNVRRERSVVLIARGEASYLRSRGEASFSDKARGEASYLRQSPRRGFVSPTKPPVGFGRTGAHFCVLELRVAIVVTSSSASVVRVRGRPGPRRSEPSYFAATRFRYQPSRVSGRASAPNPVPVVDPPLPAVHDGPGPSRTGIFGTFWPLDEERAFRPPRLSVTLAPTPSRYRGTNTTANPA